MKFPATTFVLLGLLPLAMTAETLVTVEAGNFDRMETVVDFKLPEQVIARSMLTGGGQNTPLQIGPGGHAWIIVRDLKRGEKRNYRLVDGAVPGLARAEPEPGKVTLKLYGNTVLVYRTDKTALPPDRPDLKPIFQRGGYLHPVLSPSGKQVTDDYPSNHKHHHGIWFAWTHTDFEGRHPDFWNMGDGKGTVEFVSLVQTWSGPVHAGFISKHRQVDLTGPAPKTALHELWNVRAFAVGQQSRQPYYLFDLEVLGSCATESPLKLPKYRYGGLGVRGNWAWNGQTNLNFLNSAGSTERSKGDNNETAGRWAHLGGLLDGAPTGLAILGHPDNVRAPQPQRIHPTEPFFSFAPQQAGDVEITPGKPLVLRYRFVVSDGTPDRAELDRLWNDYAYPPRVTVTVGD